MYQHFPMEYLKCSPWLCLEFQSFRGNLTSKRLGGKHSKECEHRRNEQLRVPALKLLLSNSCHMIALQEGSLCVVCLHRLLAFCCSYVFVN